MWLNQGVIVTMLDRQGTRDQEQANNRALTQKPLVVLVDNGTASASEILAAALRDNKRASLVGTRTFGNNLIQSVRSLNGGSGLAVTIAKWVTPTGKDINKVGLTPDVIVELTNAQRQELPTNPRKLGTAADPQYMKALEVLQRQ